MKSWLAQQHYPIYWLVCANDYYSTVSKSFCLDGARPLFDGDAFSDVMELSPWFVPISADCPYSDEELSKGLFLVSKYDSADVLAHLRSLLMAGLEGEMVLFRYYDLKVITPMLKRMNQEDLKKFLGNLSSISYQEENAVKTMVNPTPHLCEIPTDPWWVIKPEYLDDSMNLEQLAWHIERRLWAKIPILMNALDNPAEVIKNALIYADENSFKDSTRDLLVLATIAQNNPSDGEDIFKEFRLSSTEQQQFERFLGEQ